MALPLVNSKVSLRRAYGFVEVLPHNIAASAEHLLNKITQK